MRRLVLQARIDDGAWVVMSEGASKRTCVCERGGVSGGGLLEEVSMFPRYYVVVVALFALSCVEEGAKGKQAAGKVPTGGATAQPKGGGGERKAPCAHAAAGERKAPCARAAAGERKVPCVHATAQGGHDCPQVAGAKDEVKTRKSADGKTIEQAGTGFTGAPVVKVSQILATPEKFAGKKVSISGDVSAMCQHRRGWFAVVAEDKSGHFVRVITGPNFLVPPGSIGKHARAEGTVEVIEVSAASARHYAQDHKIGAAKATKGPVKRIVIRATGAEFS